jgi:hypothetical protein
MIVAILVGLLARVVRRGDATGGGGAPQPVAVPSAFLSRVTDPGRRETARGAD